MEPTPGFVNLSYSPGLPAAGVTAVLAIVFTGCFFFFEGWPPSASKLVRPTLFAALLGTVLGIMGRERRVELDPAQRVIYSRSAYLGIHVDVESPAVKYREVAVTVRKHSQQRTGSNSYETRHAFAAQLRGETDSLELAEYDDPRAAENAALAAARAGGWQAVRIGYEIEVEETAAAAPSANRTVLSIEEARRLLERKDGTGRSWSSVSTTTSGGRTTTVRLQFSQAERSPITRAYDAPPPGPFGARSPR
ncbi:MAG TPA: hypothetical protein DEH78_23350 [Solibacterales bacterium]|nr:hypothetical protein [Bryobacterales bacterium]